MINGGIEQQLLTIREAAQLLRCSKAHLSNVLNGKVRNVPPLNSVRLGRRRLISRRSLSSWIATVESPNSAERVLAPVDGAPMV
jgi:excisionase family DNA binding protein